jgi:hypothetical protein
MEAALERSLKRFDESLSSAYDRLVGSEPVSNEDQLKEYLTIAGDVNALKGWYDAQKAIHGAPIARTLLLQMAQKNEKAIDKL